MPCYFRRAAIADALGCVSSYQSNHKNWEADGKKGAEPTLQMDRHAAPSFYNKNMYLEKAPEKAKYPSGISPEDKNVRLMKLYQNKDWVWVPVKLRKTDIEYIEKYLSHCENKSVPVLEKTHGKYYLRFSFTEEVTFNEIPIEQQRICAVDLGINTDAVCCIMDAKGTILARKFINFKSNKDRMYHVMNRTRRKQSKYGPRSAGSLWVYVKRLNDDIARKVAAEILSLQHSIPLMLLSWNTLISPDVRNVEVKRRDLLCGIMD